MSRSLIIIGASARAAAQSATNAGYRTWCIDCFADRDLQRLSKVTRCPITPPSGHPGYAGYPGCPGYPAGIVSILDQWDRRSNTRLSPPNDALVLLTGAMENHPDIIDAIAQRRKLFGCSPQAIRSSRRAGALSSLPPIDGIGHCKVISSGDDRELTLPQHATDTQQYLIKPVNGSGGIRIETWSPDRPLLGGEYLQQKISGRAIGIVYTGNENGTLPLGVTEQIIGDPDFGASGFIYTGSVGPIDLTDSQQLALTRLGESITHRFGVTGIFGVDAIIDPNEVIWPVEINPRYTASVEVLERAMGITALEDPAPADHSSHQSSVRPKNLGRGGMDKLAYPWTDLHPDDHRAWTKKVCPSHPNLIHKTSFRPDPSTSHAKTILYAKHHGYAPDLYKWFDPDQIADVPQIGEPIRCGDPICTMFATGDNREACLSVLRQNAAQLYAHLDQTPDPTVMDRKRTRDGHE